MSEETKEVIDYFKEKIKNKLPLYEETYVDGKPYRINILQLETNFTEEQANKAEILLNLIEKQQKELEELNKTLKCTQNSWYEDAKIVDKIKAILEEYKYTEIGDSEKIIEFYEKMQSLLEKE